MRQGAVQAVVGGLSRTGVFGLTLAVRAYQCTLGPLLGPCCRFTPTCSQYAIEALRTHGVWRGLLLAGWRVLRCHPWGGSGRDPVPPPRSRGAEV